MLQKVLKAREVSYSRTRKRMGVRGGGKQVCRAFVLSDCSENSLAVHRETAPMKKTTQSSLMNSFVSCARQAAQTDLITDLIELMISVDTGEKRLR